MNPPYAAPSSEIKYIFTVHEPIKILEKLPSEAAIYFEDGNFGGILSWADFGAHSVIYDPATGDVLLRIPFNEELE